VARAINAAKRVVPPTRAGEAEIGVPRYAHPIKLETLNLKLGRRILKVVAGSRVARAIQKPMDRIDVYPNIDGMRFQALRT
jgi:hypothetical protein